MANPCKFFFLPSLERRLLLRATLLLWACRMGLWLLPLQTLRRVAAKLMAAKVSPKEDSVNVDRIVWAVALASRYVPMATCLTRALAGQVLLARYGAPASLRIGVRKNASGNLEAHAWVESGGRVLIGDSPDLLRYTRLPLVERELS